VIEGTACVDHMHICLSIPPKYAVSTIVGYLKGKSTMILFERYSKLRRNFKGHAFWARGYYVSTVGLDEAKVRKYIKNQQEHDSIFAKLKKHDLCHLYSSSFLVKFFKALTIFLCALSSCTFPHMRMSFISG
jgi:hypothetical protein